MSEPGAAMSSSGEQLFEAFLNRHDGESWREIIRELKPSIHEVDRTATEIWFYFFRRGFKRLATSLMIPNTSRAGFRSLELSSENQIDSSHEFLRPPLLASSQSCGLRTGCFDERSCHLSISRL